MKLLFRQRICSWFDSYDIYNELGNKVFTVEGKLAWGHKFVICDVYGNRMGEVKQEIFRLLPHFELYINGQWVGELKREFTFLRPAYTLYAQNNWHVRGNILQWDYEAVDDDNQLIMSATKEIMNWTDTYTIDVLETKNVLLSLMLVVAIDAEKCSRG